MGRQYYVYILTNASRTLYVGVTNDLVRRLYEHRHGLVEGFTKKYRLKQLAYYEATPEILSAITREKQIKGWLRKKKIALIESGNPDWQDLGEDLLPPDPSQRLRMTRGSDSSAPYGASG